MQSALNPTDDPAWVMQETEYDPLRECCTESRFAIGNGFLGVRGARSVSRGPMWLSWMHSLHWASWPRVYVAGLFDTPDTVPPVPALLPAPDWLRVHIHLNGRLLVLRTDDLLSHHRMLDMRRGVLITDWRQRDPIAGTVHVRTLRLVSQAERALGLQLLALKVERADVAVMLEAAIEQAGLGYEVVQLDRDLSVWASLLSDRSLAIAWDAGVRLNGVALPPSAASPLQQVWNWASAPGQTAFLARLVAIARGDGDRAAPSAAARAVLSKARRVGWSGALAAHEAAWTARWRCGDVELDGDADAQRALRFATYHLNSAVNPADEHVSIGARGLTGDAYLGHVFWDTEVFLLPFYTFTWPEAARALLMYRYHTLDAARAKAARMGWRGALYAWESADTGEETTPRQITGLDGRPVVVLCGEQEQHISADIAYAVWQYWQASGDDDFLCRAGAEILLETARFWASRARPEADGQHHIRGVIGPDEYHESIDDNTFTNVMAGWNIRRALDVVVLLRDRWPERWAALAERLTLEAAELQQWRAVADTMATGFDPARGVHEQFAGYFALEDIDPAAYAGRTASMDMVLGRDRTRRSQVLKQADAVALLALLPEEFPAAVAHADFRYYEPRCAHDSSLSRPMHALAAARLGHTESAVRYFRDTAATDLADAVGVSAGGVHIAALGGLWQVAVLGFAGVMPRDGTLSFRPNLPEGWRRMAFRLHWRGRLLHVCVGPPGTPLEATVEAGEALDILVGGERRTLLPGRTAWVPVTTEPGEG